MRSQKYRSVLEDVFGTDNCPHRHDFFAFMAPPPKPVFTFWHVYVHLRDKVCWCSDPDLEWCACVDCQQMEKLWWRIIEDESKRYREAHGQ